MCLILSSQKDNFGNSSHKKFAGVLDEVYKIFS